MKAIRHSSLWRLTFSLILLFLITSFGPSQSLALSSSDLIVVYNLNIQNSKGVAHYYAKKRAVPLSNIVGVRVPTSERMARLDFESELIPPIKTVVERLKADCKKPAILLIYGIPLFVSGSVRGESDRAFVAFAQDKVKEYQDVVLQLISQLDHLVLGNSSQVLAPKSPEKNYETIDVLKMAGESFRGGLRYLIEAKSKEGKHESMLGASSVLIRLVGAASMTKAILEGAGKGEDDYLKFFKNQELLVPDIAGCNRKYSFTVNCHHETRVVKRSFIISPKIVSKIEIFISCPQLYILIDVIIPDVPGHAWVWVCD